MASAWAAVLAVVLVLPGVAPPPREVALGEAFRLRVGESARIGSESLELGLQDVPADSRCPKGEQCVREGEAVVRVRLRMGDEVPETLELRTSPREAGTVGARGFLVRLLRLDPYPVTGRTLEAGQYVATLEISRGSGASSEDR